MKNILVTGHNGYIGPLLVNLLMDKGFNVVGLDTNFFNQDCEFYHQQRKGVKSITKDIREIDESDLKGVDAVCHLAGLSNDPLGELNKNLTFDINHKASVTLAELSKKAGVKKFIFASSCSLYGIAGEDALTEEAEFAPVTAYAKSKVLVEKETSELANDTFCVTWLRNATAYGISPKLRLDIVVNNLVGWALITGEIRILSDGTPWRPLVHAEDIARAFVAVIEAPVESVNLQAFNVGMNSENYRIKDIAELVNEKVPNCKLAITGEHGSDTRTYRVNFDKIWKTLPNFEPQWNLSKGIDQIYEKYLTYKMDKERFEGKNFIRVNQLQYLMDNRFVDNQLYWR